MSELSGDRQDTYSSTRIIEDASNWSLFSSTATSDSDFLWSESPGRKPICSQRLIELKGFEIDGIDDNGRLEDSMPSANSVECSIDIAIGDASAFVLLVCS